MQDIATKITNFSARFVARVRAHCERHSEALEAGAGFAVIGGLFIAGAALPVML